jgi:hypothetical protein
MVVAELSTTFVPGPAVLVAALRLMEGSVGGFYLAAQRAGERSDTGS